MNSKGAALLGLALGFVAGASTAYLYLKNQMPEEITEFIPVKNKDWEETEKPCTDENKEDLEKAQVIMAKNSYSQYYDEKVEAKKDEDEQRKKSKPYIISPGEVGDIPEYDKFTLKYYRDGILLDDANEPLDDIESIVGDRFMTHFGEYEEDTVYVRNDRTQADYEILFIDMDFMDNNT